MAKHKHTDGPWEAGRDLPFGRKPRVHGGGKLIAEFGNAEADCEDEWEANATLASAAPDMLEALSEGVDLIEGDLTGTDWKKACRAFVSKSRAAIAKATRQ